MIRDKILEAAGQLIVEKGVDRTSLLDIAKLCGISKGTLYYYFPTKNDLVYEVAELHMKGITDRIYLWLDENRAKTSLKEVIKVVLEIFLGAETREKLHLYLIQEAIAENEKLKNKFREKYCEWRQIVETELKKILEEKDNNCGTMAYIIVAAIDGFVIQSIFNGQDIPIDLIAEYLAKGL